MRTTIRDIMKMKLAGERIPVLTCYDYTSAKILDSVGIPMLLVGDSLGMVVHGHDSTIPVTLDMMILHCAARRARSVERADHHRLTLRDVFAKRSRRKPAQRRARVFGRRRASRED